MALTQYVNPFIGTTFSDVGGTFSGDNNPGAQTPFGMVSFGPDTRGSGGGYGFGSGGYHYDDTAIQFFSMTHLNGPGCRSQGAVAMLPTDNVEQISAANSGKNIIMSSGNSFDHKNEAAEPGYYKVKFNSGILSEMTATTRSGMARFTYSDSAKAILVIDPTRNNTQKSGMSPNLVEIVLGADGQSISGHTVVGPFCGAQWYQPVYFHAQFDKKIKRETSPVTNGVAILHFDLTDADKVVQIKVGISSVSVANAKQNLDTENKDWAFDTVKANSAKNWNSRLNTIQIGLADPVKMAAAKLTADQAAAADTNLRKFYSAFYRVFSGPTVYSDVNGDYRSMKQTDLKQPGDIVPERATENVANYPFKVDGKDATYKTHYSGYSMWDTYRSQAQMVALIAPEEASDMMQSLVADAQQCGAFPHWVDGSEDTTPMEGDHAPNVVAGSYVFGAKKFDLENARKFMKQSVFDPNSACNDKSSSGGALAVYRKKGYVPSSGSGHSSSGTIERMMTDRSVAAFLAALPSTAGADKADIETLVAGAKNWTNIFDDTTKTLRAKDASGAMVGGSFHESTEENYIWTFAYDWTSLISKLGGKAKAIDRLNNLVSFDTGKPFEGKEPTGAQLDGQAEGGYPENSHKLYIGNEPAFQAPWAYNWAGGAKYTQYILPIIMNNTFLTTPGGLPGNDDMGATSSWYVWSALGLFPVIPSTPGLAVATPQFSDITLWFADGNKLHITTDKEAMLAKAPYIKEMKLGGTVYQGTWLPLDKIAKGGEIRFTLSDKPTDWGSGDDLTPPSGPDADYTKATAKPLPGVQMIQ
ncbi:glycoside hydrolase family 92 protein [Phyllobacterium sp. 628]|nr:glycoside hydrolase family 92 protein [Phyllobacterium sp. 628]